MKEQDNIRDLFSKGLENQTTPVRPEIWNGLQAKMAAAGIASGSAAAVKGISMLTKWFIGGAAATAIAVTTVVLTTDTRETEKKEKSSVTASSTGSDSGKQVKQNEIAADNGVAGGNTVVADAPAGRNRSIGGSENSPLVKIVIPEQVEPDNVLQPAPKARVNNGEQVAAPPVNKAVQPEPAKADKAQPVAVKQDPKTDNKPASRSKIVKIPNVFTPNNDGDNDVFSIESRLVSDFSVTIMNQSSNVIYRSSDPDFKWDGKTMSGDDAPAGSYVCVIIAKGENNETLKEYKVVELRK